MSLVEIVLQPRDAIGALTERDEYAAPFGAYLLLVIAQSVDRALRYRFSFPEAAAEVIQIAIGAAFAMFLVGGTLHLIARVFGGRPGFLAGVRAMGYAFFWPSIVFIAVAVTRGIARATGAFQMGDLLSTIRMATGIWIMYLIICAFRGWHGLSLARAIAAYVCFFLACLGFIFGFGWLAHVSGV
jgi:hypothetical protein